jgi:multidrug efflux system membrane fusion protein
MRRINEYPSEAPPDRNALILYTPFAIVQELPPEVNVERELTIARNNKRKADWRLIRRIALPVTLIVMLFFLSACTEAESANNASPPPTVDVAPVIAKNVRLWDEFPGRISAIHSVDIRPRVTGYIDTVEYVEGAEVSQGDLLFRIDARSYKVAVLSATARLDRAKAAVEVAAGRNQRALALRKASAISTEEADDRASTLTQAQADVSEAEAALDLAELNLSFTEVRAPVAGKVGLATLTVGNLAIADQTHLTTIISQDPVYVEFNPDEHSYLKYLAEDRASKGGAGKLVVKVALANEEGFPHEGEVNFLDNRLHSATGSIRLRAKLLNSDKFFTPGLFARVRVGREGETEAILVDDKAILTDQDRRYVFVLDPENRASRREVEIDRLVGGLRVINEGLVAGDRLVVSGHQKIYAAGMTVVPSRVATAKNQ